MPRHESVSVRRDRYTVETFEVNLSDEAFQVDALSNVELSIATPDGRLHKVRVNTSWFIPPALETEPWR